MLIVEPADPAAPGPKALLQASHALMQSLFPADGCHFLSLDSLKAPHIHFFAAREGSATLGTAALAVKPGYGELKSLFTAPEARGKGVASALLRQIEDAARAEGLAALKLETGDKLPEALALYARHGFTECGPFGDYVEHPNSVFFEKPL